MAWTFKLVSSPVDQYSATIPGVVTGRRMIGQPGYVSIGVGDDFPFIPQFNMKDDTIVIPIQDGPDRSFLRKRPQLTLSFNMEGWTSAQMDSLRKAMQSQRLLHLSPNFDDSTVVSASFANIERQGGVAEVGYNGLDSYLSRLTGLTTIDACRSYERDLDLLMETKSSRDSIATQEPKFVPGYVGKAILIESATEQLVKLDASWAVVAGALVGPALSSNHPTYPGQVFFCDAGGSQMLDIPTSGINAATAAKDYCAWVDVKGSGSVALRATHNSGGTPVTGTQVILTSQWQRVSVNWLQVGTTIGLKLIPGLNGASGQVANTQVQRANVTGSCLPATALLSNCDALKMIDGTVIPAVTPLAGFTVNVWCLRIPGQTTSNDTAYFATWNDGSTNDGYFATRKDENSKNWKYHARLCHASADISYNSASTPAATGSWTMVTLVVQGSAGALSVTMYENGASIGSSTFTPTGVGKVQVLYVGSDIALASPLKTGLNCPLDSIRVDARAWSAAEVLNEYTMKSDAGIRRLLALMSGRRFRITSAPSEFVGPFTDSFSGTLRLEETGYSPPGLI